jgi:hypothetical protein
LSPNSSNRSSPPFLLFQQNQQQVLGTHNSYHIAPDDEIFNSFGGQNGILAPWTYSHPSIQDQLELYNVRSMELDVAEDSPQGGRFAQSAGLQIAGIDGYTPAKTNPKLLEPGFKVLHIPDFDFNSHCTTLKECLQIIKQWSDSNPTHLPFSLYIELKEANVLESTLGDIGMQLLNNLLNASTIYDAMRQVFAYKGDEYDGKIELLIYTDESGFELIRSWEYEIEGYVDLSGDNQIDCEGWEKVA